MTPALVVAACLGPLQLEHAVRLTPEVTSVRQGDPLLVRVDVRFGLLRPSLHVGTLTPRNRGLLVAVRKPGGTGYDTVRTVDYDADRYGNFGITPASQLPPEPYGKTDAAFLWLVSDRAPQDHEAENRARTRDQPPPRQPEVTVFDAPGEYQLRAEVRLRDGADVYYVVRSAPVTVRVGPRAFESRAASDAVRSVLYSALPGSGYLPSPAVRDQLRDALPLLGLSGDGSAVRRLLALNALQTSPPGQARSQAIAECDRVRAGLPPVGRGQFDLDYAAALASIREFRRALTQVQLAPAGPRRLWDGVHYYGQSQGQRQPKP